MEEEDPVVQEIPVFLCQALAKQLYVFQYPIKPATTDWNDSKVVNSLIKPKNKQVKIEFGIDTYSDRYCESKGEQIALNTDGLQDTSRYIKDKEKEKAQFFKSGIMDKMTYESSLPCTENTKYVVAIIQDNELHCTPVNGLIQLRPSYSYFDKQDKREKETEKSRESDEEEEGESEVTQVTVKFARQETDLAKKARERSYNYISQKSAEEAWCDSVWWHSNSDKAELERMKLFSDRSQGASLSLPPAEYLPSLVPAPPAEEAENVGVDGAGLCGPRDLRSLRNMSLVDQCKCILKDAKLITFRHLHSLVSGVSAAPPSEAETARAAAAAGVAVRGLWAPRSDLVYTAPSAASGVPIPVMCAARDYVLYLFTQSPYIDRRKVSLAVRLPPAEVLDILATVSKYDPNKGWVLFLPPDPEFENRFPDIIQRQNLFWEAKQRQFNEMLSGDTVIIKRQRKKSQRDSFSSDVLLSPKPRSNSVSSNYSHGEDGENEKKRAKNKSGTGVGKRTRNLSSSSVTFNDSPGIS